MSTRVPRGAALVFLLAISASGCTRAHTAAAPRAEVSGPVRVLVYNIHAGKDAAGVDNLERVAALIDSTRADVVLLQEVDRHTTRSGGVDHVEVLTSRTGMHGAFGNTLDYQGGEYGIAVLSRWPIVRDSLVRLPVEPAQQRAGGSYEPRGVLHAVIAAPGETLHVLNTHLDPGRDDHYRRQEVRHVVTLAAQAAAAGGTVLMGGDLNATPESAVIGIVVEAGLQDAWAVCGTGDGGTFPARGPVKRIDYLFMPASRGCQSAVVIETQASDHRPVLVVVEPRSGSAARRP